MKTVSLFSDGTAWPLSTQGGRLQPDQVISEPDIHRSGVQVTTHLSRKGARVSDWDPVGSARRRIASPKRRAYVLGGGVTDRKDKTGSSATIGGCRLRTPRCSVTISSSLAGVEIMQWPAKTKYIGH